MYVQGQIGTQKKPGAVENPIASYTYGASARW